LQELPQVADNCYWLQSISNLLLYTIRCSGMSHSHQLRHTLLLLLLGMQLSLLPLQLP
jgi:hypothetical protein